MDKEQYEARQKVYADWFRRFGEVKTTDEVVCPYCFAITTDMREFEGGDFEGDWLCIHCDKVFNLSETCNYHAVTKRI